MRATDHPTPDLTALVEDHLHLVQRVVHEVARHYPQHVDRDELWAAGAAGLVDAASRYDPTTGVPFARYATIRVRGAVIDSTRSRDWASRTLRRRARELRAVTSELEQELGASPTVAELAAASTMPVAAVEACRRELERSTVLELDRTVELVDGGAETLQALLVDDSTAAVPHQAAEQRELHGTVRLAVLHLHEPHRQVLVRHYYHGDAMRDVAADLGVTEARVSQIRAEAINVLRAYLGSEFEGVPPVPRTAPGRRRRDAYVTTMRRAVTWRQRFDAVDDALAPLPRSA